MQNPMIHALTTFASQPPRLQFANYGDPKTYRQEARSIRQDLARYTKALAAAHEAGTTDEDLRATLDRGGRLQIHQEHPRREGKAWAEVYRVDYTPGQYFPTEYRKAAAAALERANAHALSRTAPTYTEPARTVAEMKARNKRAGFHWFDNALGKGSRYTMAFPGCLIEEQPDRAPEPFSIHFQTLKGAMSLAFYRERFATLAQAKERANEIHMTGMEPKE